MVSSRVYTALAVAAAVVVPAVALEGFDYLDRKDTIARTDALKAAIATGSPKIQFGLYQGQITCSSYGRANAVRILSDGRTDAKDTFLPVQGFDSGVATDGCTLNSEGKFKYPGLTVSTVTMPVPPKSRLPGLNEILPRKEAQPN